MLWKWSFFFSKNAGDLRLIVLRRKEGVRTPNLQDNLNTTQSHTTLLLQPKKQHKLTEATKLAARRPTVTPRINRLGDGQSRGKALEPRSGPQPALLTSHY